MPLIKRYANRKLYDTETGRYVTLEDIGEMILAGAEVTVVDHATGADLTTVTLLQVMFEQEKRIGGQLPRAMLTRLIQGGDTRLRSLRRALDAFIDPMKHAEEEIRRRLQRLREGGSLTPEEAARLEELLLAPELSQEEVETIAEEAAFEPAAGAEDLEELARQIERLEQEITSLKEKRSLA
jgi:polyhydroxyalkanoate synthesis repressor PhaR